MFLILSKLLPPLIYPIGLASIFILLALITSRRSKLHNTLLFISLVILWLGGNRWLALGLTKSLEWRYFPPSEIPYTDVIVTLGGGTQSALYPRPLAEVNGAGDRVIYTAWLYQQGKAGHILASGGTIGWLSSDEDPAKDIVFLLRLMGIPEEAIWTEASSRNTYENALYCRQILEPKGINRILLVTSALHMPRAVMLFEQEGFEVIPAPTDYVVTQAGWDQMVHSSLAGHIFNFLPSAENMALTTRSLKEYIGMLVYQLKQ